MTPPGEAALQAALTFSLYFGAAVVSLVVAVWFINLYKSYKLAEKDREEFEWRWRERHGGGFPGESE